jgi:stage 0 sporulation regulatory protein
VNDVVLVKEVMTNKLECKINSLRTQMLSNGELKGISHPQTIKYSQKLDLLLYKYQLIKLIK